MSQGLITVCKSEGEAVSQAWDEFIFTSPSATVSHLYGWRRIISEAYGHRTFYLKAYRGDKIAGILPIVQVKSSLFGNILSSMPFQDYGGILSDDAEAYRLLLDEALRLKRECRATSLELRHREVLLPDIGLVRRDKVSMILDISAGQDNLWNSFSPKVRNQVRKAQKSGLNTKLGGSELLEEFYRPFAVNMRDLGSPVHNPEFFAKIFSVFAGNARTVLVRKDKETIGGLIALFHQDSVIVPWASCFRQYFPMCPNNLLYWDAIQYACSRGCKSFDFGRSSVDSGTYRFKLQWGAQPVPLNWQVFSDKSVEESRTLRMASALWKHIPVTLATALGPQFRRYLTQ